MSIPANTKILSEKPNLHESSTVLNSRLGTWTDIGPNSLVQDSIIGDYTYTDGDVNIIYANIGKFCSIASHVRINPGNHPMWRVSQHHMTYRRVQYQFGNTDDQEIFNWRKEHEVTIGHDVWIGHNAIIMPGVTIGNGAVIGSGAVVTKDVDSYTVAAEVPAKPIRKRFRKEIAEELEQIAWWDWTREELEERFDELNDVEQFIKKYKKQ
ncbi:DapH/DapD/GlmU-related protein [Alteribacillus sp. YIM 98480]|uniref:DapH/DapD/GlmU-related protein n=1 Tax=Alteribacillus sp. YIM 98480 TaxID=2606599 RepID=UPI00131BE162|nr:DapH/DapD/GlmU-related protein [Alteribacillus sp. YIM 98480]